MFCAICTSDIPSGAMSFDMDGFRVCERCQNEEPDNCEPEHRQRGYESPGGVGHAFGRQVAESHDRIVSPATVELDRQIQVRRPKSPVELYDAWMDGGQHRKPRSR